MIELGRDKHILCSNNNAIRRCTQSSFQIHFKRIPHIYEKKTIEFILYVSQLTMLKGMGNIPIIHK